MFAWINKANRDWGAGDKEHILREGTGPEKLRTWSE